MKGAEATVSGLHATANMLSRYKDSDLMPFAQASVLGASAALIVADNVDKAKQFTLEIFDGVDARMTELSSQLQLAFKASADPSPPDHILQQTSPLHLSPLVHLAG